MEEFLGSIMGPLMAFIIIFAVIAFIVGIVVYIYMAIVLMTIAKKTRTPNGWLAWIPIANMVLMTQIAKVPWWTMLIVIFGSFLSAIPGVGFILSLGVMAIPIWWWWRIAERRNHPGWFALLFLIPVVGLVIMGIIAWKD